LRDIMQLALATLVAAISMTVYFSIAVYLNNPD